MTRPFHPAELTGLDGSAPPQGELAELAPVARRIEAAFGARDVHPSVGFVDRVMSAVASEPVPQPAIAAGLAVRGRRPRALVRSLGDMWRVATTGGRPFAVRAQAAAFVLVAFVALSSLSGIATVGAWQWLVPAVPQSGAPTAVPPTPSATTTQTASPSPEPSTSPEPTRSPEPSATPELPSSSSGPSETSSGDHQTGSPSRAPGSTPTPRPTDTPEPTETAQPTQTPNPTETPHPSDGSTDRSSDSS